MNDECGERNVQNRRASLSILVSWFIILLRFPFFKMRREELECRKAWFETDLVEIVRGFVPQPPTVMKPFDLLAE